MVNESLIRETVAAIEADQEHWDQRYYLYSLTPQPQVCSTRMCFAGWAVFLALGADEFRRNYWEGVWHALTREEARLYFPPNDGIHVSIEREAQKLLGLTNSQVWDIFYRTSIKTVEELKEVITEVTGIAFE